MSITHPAGPVDMRAAYDTLRGGTSPYPPDTSNALIWLLGAIPGEDIDADSWEPGAFTELQQRVAAEVLALTAATPDAVPLPARRGTRAARRGLPLSEGAFQTRVMHYAHLRRWRFVHIRPARTRDKQWRTPYEGDPGLPDLVLARRDRGVLLAELKSDTGRPTADQKAWLAAAGPSGRLWAPADWPEIVEDLK